MSKIKQIAGEAGLSPNTVLRILRGENKEVWPSAVRRAQEVRQIARRLGYLPNGSARAIRRGKFNAVGLLLSTDEGRSYLPDDLFNGIHDALHAQGMRLIVSKVHDERLTDPQAMPSLLQEWACDGLLINYTDHIPADMISLVRTFHLPSIWINCKQAADCVRYDDHAGGERAVEYLLNLGHRRIVYLDFLPLDALKGAHYSREDRYAGYVAAMRRAGLTPTPRDHFAGVPVKDRLTATVGLLRASDRPTAVISYDAGPRLLYAAAQAGLRVPEDLSVLSFSSGTREASSRPGGESYIGRSLTLMRVPGERAGRQAAARLLSKIATPKKSQPVDVIPLELDEGDTCGPPKRSSPDGS